MALWAIDDFHLSFSTDKPMEIFDSVWKNHEKKSFEITTSEEAH